MRRAAAAAAAVRSEVRAKADAGYLLEAMRRACLATVGAKLDMLVMDVRCEGCRRCHDSPKAYLQLSVIAGASFGGGFG